MNKFQYFGELDDFKKYVEEKGITMMEFMDLYFEFSELDPEAKLAISRKYAALIKAAETKKNKNSQNS